MPLKHWKKLEDKVIFENKYWHYKLDRFEIEPGNTGDYHYVHTNGSTMIVPVIENNNLLLVNQYRYLIGKESIEFPCGSVGNNIALEDNARKELIEETGYSSNDLIKVGEFAPYNGVSDEMCTVYVAQNLFKGYLPKDETEEFELIEASAQQLEQMISNGTIWDGMTITAWTCAKKYLL